MTRMTHLPATRRPGSRSRRAFSGLATLVALTGLLAGLGGAGVPVYKAYVHAGMAAQLEELKNQAALFSAQDGEGRSVHDPVAFDHAADVAVPQTALGRAYMSMVPRFGTWTFNADNTVTYRSTLPGAEDCLVLSVVPAAPVGYPGGGEYGDANTEQAVITDCAPDTPNNTAA